MTLDEIISEGNRFSNTLERNNYAAEVYHPGSYYAGIDKGFVAGANFTKSELMPLLKQIPEKLMNQLKEIIEGKYFQVFDGVIIEKSKEKISMICVDKDECDVRIVDLDPSEYNFKVIDKEYAERTFNIAVLNLMNNFNDAKKKLLIAQRNLEYAQKKYTEFF